MKLKIGTKPIILDIESDFPCKIERTNDYIEIELLDNPAKNKQVEAKLKAQGFIEEESS